MRTTHGDELWRPKGRETWKKKGNSGRGGERGEKIKSTVFQGPGLGPSFLGFEAPEKLAIGLLKRSL